MFLFPQEVAASAWQVLHNAHICNVTGVFKVTPCNNTRKYRTSNTLKTLTQYLFIAFALLHADIDVCFSSLHFCTQTFIPAAFILLLIFHTWAGFHLSFCLIQSSLPSIRLDACKNKQCLGTNNEHMLSVKLPVWFDQGGNAAVKLIVSKCEAEQRLKSASFMSVAQITIIQRETVNVRTKF